MKQKHPLTKRLAARFVVGYSAFYKPAWHNIQELWILARNFLLRETAFSAQLLHFPRFHLLTSVPMARSSARLAKNPFQPTLFSTARYLIRPESQTFAISVATFAVLAFFPFMIVMIMLIRRVFESPGMNTALLEILRDHLPIGQEMVIKVLDGLVNARKQAQIGSLALLLLATRGVFMPLEVALNRIWGFDQGRSWIHNQAVGALLAFSCGALALLSVAMTAANQYLLFAFFGRHSAAFRLSAFVLMKIVATAASIIIFFLIYWLVPCGKVAARRVLPAAIAFGLLWEVLKYVYIAALPHLSFQEVYGPFSVSVALIFWAYLSGLLLLAGAFVAANQD